MTAKVDKRALGLASLHKWCVLDPGSLSAAIGTYPQKLKKSVDLFKISVTLVPRAKRSG